jgi:hypothetical protein
MTGVVEDDMNADHTGVDPHVGSAGHLRRVRP